MLGERVKAITEILNMRKVFTLKSNTYIACQIDKIEKQKLIHL